MMKYLSLEWKKLAGNYWFFLAIALVGLLYGYAFHHRDAVIKTQQAKLDSAMLDQQIKYQTYRTLMDSAVRLSKPFEKYDADPRNPVQLSRLVPRYAIFEQTPSAILATGQSDLFNRQWALHILGRDPRLVAADIKNPIQLMFGQLDPATVLILLLPLLIISFAYNILSGEREEGTLKIVSIQAQSIKKWITAKLLLQAIILFTFFFLETIILSVAYRIDWLEQPFHFLLFLLFLLLYILFWFALSLLVNLYNRSSAINAVWLMGGWLLFIFILPSLLNMLAYQAFKVPSRVSFITGYRNAYGDAERGGRQEALNKYFFDHPELGKPDTSNKKFAGNAFYKEAMVFYEHVYKEAEPIYGNYLQKRKAADQFANTASFLSPASLLQSGLNQVGGTSGEQFIAFQDAAMQFRQSYMDWIKDKLLQDKELTWNEVNKLPSFVTAPNKISSGVLWVLMGLFIQCLLLYVWIQLRFKEMHAIIL